MTTVMDICYAVDVTAIIKNLDLEREHNPGPFFDAVINEVARFLAIKKKYEKGITQYFIDMEGEKHIASGYKFFGDLDAAVDFVLNRVDYLRKKDRYEKALAQLNEEAQGLGLKANQIEMPSFRSNLITGVGIGFGVETRKIIEYRAQQKAIKTGELAEVLTPINDVVN
tara:strand:+ start:6571 stop:7077 length:507 start_codon:yes stop_codon:yes gene_type:complete